MNSYIHSNESTISSEYLFEHGLIDDIVERKRQKDYIYNIFKIFTNNEILKGENNE